MNCSESQSNWGYSGRACYLVGYTYGELPAVCMPSYGDTYAIRSMISNVSITVNAATVRRKMDADMIPEFYYD